MNYKKLIASLVFASLLTFFSPVTTASPTDNTEFVPLYGNIKPLAADDTLYTFKKMSHRKNDNYLIAAQTLQGVIARTSRPRIWIDAGDQTFCNYLKKHYGIKFDNRYADDFTGLLSEMKQYTSGKYVLFDMKDNGSISAAVTLAGLWDAVAIDVQLQQKAESAGYSIAIDACGKDSKWVFDNYSDKLNNNAIIVHTNDYKRHPSVGFLRDFGPALKLLDYWYENWEYSEKVYDWVAPCSPVYGWQDPTVDDEGDTVKFHSEKGMFQMPSDWMLNLTVHAGMGPALKNTQFTQKAPRIAPIKETGVHYVTFVLSDMDNILTEIGTNSFYSNKSFYANSHRGQFPMSWGMAPSLVELSPAGVDMWYNSAAENDAFVGYCGLGYFYPSVAPYMDIHSKRLEGFLKRADLKTLLLIDKIMPGSKLTQDTYQPLIHPFSSLEQIRGMFYLEYVRYAPYDGKIMWFDGKPLVTARFDFRNDPFYSAVRTNPESLAASINAKPKDPTKEDGYTFVTVHAWSKGMDDIFNTVQKLDDNVKVVDAETFIELIRLNKPSD